MEKNQIMEELGSDMPLRDGSSLVFFYLWRPQAPVFHTNYPERSAFLILLFLVPVN